MKFVRPAAPVVVLALLTACVSVRARHELLDLTSAPAPAWYPIASRVTGDTSGKAQAPLRVRLLKTDRTAYRPLETVSYDVSLENDSQQPLIIPWSLDSLGYHPVTQESRRLMLTFMLSRPDGTDAVIQSVVLYGAPDKPGSLKTLSPRERVVIRAPAALVGNLLPKDATNPILNPSLTVRAKASVLFDAQGDPLSRFAARVSENTIPFRIVATVAPLPVTSNHARPAIIRVLPESVSPGAIVRLDGYRLGADRDRPGEAAPSAHYFFSNGNARLSAERRTVGFSGPGNDPNVRQQVVTIVAPPELTPGVWNIVVELDGLEGTSPAPVAITAWSPPQIERLSPDRVNPGGVITVNGSHFSASDTVEVVDAGGMTLYSASSVNAAGTAVVIVRTDEPESERFVRLRTWRSGGPVVSNSLSYFVQHAPLAPALTNQTRRAVGVGQWMDLEGPRLDWSERTEVEFSQDGGVTVSDTAAPKSPRVQVPVRVVPGQVTVRTRIWHGGVGSEWSTPATYRVALRPIAPVITTLRVGPELEQRVNLGVPVTPDRFEVAAGDPVRLSGTMPVSPTASVPVTITRLRESIDVPSTRPDAYSVQFTIPKRVSKGPWKITLGAVDGTPGLTLPITMHVR